MAWKANTSSTTKRRVMVVADPTAESMGALQYMLSHAMHDNDDLILIHIPNPKKGPSIKSLIFRRHSDPGIGTISTFDPAIASNNEGGSCRGGSVGGGIGGGGDFLETMKRVCKGMYPNSRVWIEKVELRSLHNNNNNMGNDNNNNNNNNNNKGALILLKCKELSVDLLVVGQRRHLVSVLLGPTRSLSGASSWGSSKSVDMVEYLIENSPCTCVAVQKKGQNSGYILNSRTHTNFWLLV